jgi:uncharacterized membrane protein YfcA
MTDPLQPESFALIALVFILAGLVKGVVGLGLPAVSLGLLTIFLGLKTAIVLIIAPSLATNLWQGLAGGTFIATLRRIWSLLAFTALGIWIGTGLLAQSDGRLLAGLLGLLLSIYAITALAMPNIKVPPAWEPWLSPPIGTISGIFAGLTGSYTFPAIAYIQALGFPRDQMIQAMGIAFLTCTITLGLGLANNGMLSRELAIGSFAGMIPAFGGLFLGQRLRRAIPEEQFRRVLLGALLVMGIYIGIKALA